MHWRRDQTHAKGCANTADCIETRFTAWPKGFAQGFACDARILRKLRHAPRSGNVAEPSRAFVIPEVVIPDPIRDPVPRMHLIADQVRNDKLRGNDTPGHLS